MAFKQNTDVIGGQSIAMLGLLSAVDWKMSGAPG